MYKQGILPAACVAAFLFALAYIYYRKRVKASARASQNGYGIFRALVENNQGIIALLDENLRIIFRSASAEKITGYSNEEFPRLPEEQIHPEDVPHVRAAFAEARIHPGMTVHMNHRLRRKDGSYIWLEGTVRNMLQDPKIRGFIVNLLDITDRRKTEEQLIKTNRLYLFVSRINQAIVQATDDHALLSETCRIAVDIGGFRMAWIGLLDGERSSLIPVTFAGEGAEYLSGISIIPMEGPPESMGPGGRALREGYYFMCNDIEAAPDMEPWREAAMEHNYQSSIGLPIKRSGTVVGLFSLYADKKNFFDTEEIDLLIAIAADISFAIDGFAKDALRKRTEEELIISTLNYQTLTESSPVGIFRTDASGWTTYVNPRWCQITGIRKEDALGNGWQGAVHPDDRAVLFREWEQATVQERASVAEYRFVNPDGKVTWILGQAVPERGIDREILGWVGTATDITRLKTAEMLLEKSEDNYRRAETLGRMGHWELDLQNNYLSWSDEIYRIFDLRKEEFGNRFQDFLEWVHPEDRETFEYLQAKALSGRAPLNFTHRIITPKGTLKYVHEIGELRTGENGDILYLTGTVQDITEQVKSRDQVVNERNLSDSVINSLPGVFYLYNKEGRFRRWNLNFEKVTGYNSEEMRRLHPLDFFDTDEKELLRQKIGSVFDTGEDAVQANFLTKSGVKIPYFFTGKAITYEDEPCLLGVGIDFSDKVRAEEQLRELAAHLQSIREQERVDIARDIHDDLGQQLTAVKISMFRLTKHIQGNEALENGIRSIIDMVSQGIESIRRISTELRPGILDDLGLVEAMKWQIEEFEKRFSIPIASAFFVAPVPLNPEVSINTFRIFQETLTNIARHAEASQVDVRFTINHEWILLEVRDNGKGLPSNGVKTKRTLGLLGMRERARMIGGRLDIDSRPGYGTTVLVEVPLSKNITL
ncbi:PAS domain S-box protein [Dinghuibacter silviterrae]|uniref:histidine kinase n=1 Tax=Dinghuibacter silviterrae TaxID=1539049 RepID=A0A4R8DW39_9BACT|nr:PAS domain S-box protein [Dinghuibacter silviterrae]TDX01431.1 PAS domain S-box-containing protein [Dinghuibacter silviterrae]